jgi:hypothetical protein
LKPCRAWEQYGAGSTQYCTPLHAWYPRCSPSIVFNFPFVSDTDWTIFAQDAFNAFATQIPTDVSILNFGWELRELGELIPKLEKTLQSTVSGGFLNFSFGWKPFVGDLMKLSGLLSTVSAKIEHLRATWGKKTRLGHYASNVVSVQTGPLSVFNQRVNTWDAPDRTEYWQLKGYRCDLRAGGYLYHRLKDLDSAYGYIRACAAALGLGNPLKAVWQALPYSFVVDWFLGLSRHLDTLDINPFKGDWQVSDFSSSAIANVVWSVYQDSAPHGMQYLGRVRAKRYERISHLPVPASVFTLTGLSPQQLLLSTAMLAQH